MTDRAASPTPKPWISGIAAYVPGKAADDSGRRLVKLSANENPFGTSPAAMATASGAIGDLATYPDPGAGVLRQAIADVHGLDPDRIVVGTGSGELLHMIAGVYAGPGDEAIYVNYGFSLYDIVVRRAGATPVIAPDRDYGTDVDAVLACVGDRTRLVFIANPNNPTGTFISRSELARLHAALPPDVVLVIDQAYAEYVPPEEEDGGLELAAGHANVFATRTFSKIHGLAAERIGWGYGAAEMIDALNRIRGAFNLTTAGQAAAAVAVANAAWIEVSRRRNAEGLAAFERDMAALGNHGIRCVPSRANFSLLLFEGAVTAETAYKALMRAGYATRWLPNQGLPHGLRITIGTEAQMRAVVAVIRNLVGE